MAAHSIPQKQSSTEDVPGIFSSNSISLAVPAAEDHARPPAVHHMSAPAYQSPLRHHRRQGSVARPAVKETLNARSEYSNSEDDGAAQHRINQYHIKQEIGRGSFGAVHLAIDQYGTEYAVKEFSKSRLRKRAQSNLLRRPNAVRKPGQLSAALGFNSPLHRHSSHETVNNALDLIKEEIAIMKKLNHPNLVSLIEVLDDPDEDSLYMVLEMCKKGVVMKVGLDEPADPYDEESCRCWFRDMILGIEYLHAQGIVHRDIKPDNCLVTSDDVLKIVDFGVSEMFNKDSDMSTAKSAGSPAFMPPELCVPKHGAVSGRACDIWSMGVTLYCLRYGRIPFENHSMLELYEAIRNNPLDLSSETNEDFKDLMNRILEKDPKKRITMDELREHPWVTKGGTDPLLPKEENTSDLIEPPTEEELAEAITGKMKHLLIVMKAVNRFRQLLFRRRPELLEGILGRGSRIVQPPLSMSSPTPLRKSRSVDTDDRRPVEGAITLEGVHRKIPISDKLERLPAGMDYAAKKTEKRIKLEHRKRPKSPKDAPAESHADVASHQASPPSTRPSHRHETGKGQAHDPLLDTLFLDIGTGTDDDIPATIPDPPKTLHVVSESPGAIDINVYEKAYQEEVQKILAAKGKSATLYLTRRVEGNKEIRENENIVKNSESGQNTPRTGGGMAGLLARARERLQAEEGVDGAQVEGEKQEEKQVT